MQNDCNSLNGSRFSVQQLHRERHRAPDCSKAAICEHRQQVRRVRQGDGYRCITHREGPSYISGSIDTVRVARLQLPAMMSTNSARVARQQRAAFSCRSRATSSKISFSVSSGLELQPAACKRWPPANSSPLLRCRVAHPGQTECCPGYLSLICDNVH